MPSNESLLAHQAIINHFTFPVEVLLASGKQKAVNVELYSCFKLSKHCQIYWLKIRKM